MLNRVTRLGQQGLMRVQASLLTSRVIQQGMLLVSERHVGCMSSDARVLRSVSSCCWRTLGCTHLTAAAGQGSRGLAPHVQGNTLSRCGAGINSNHEWHKHTFPRAFSTTFCGANVNQPAGTSTTGANSTSGSEASSSSSSSSSSSADKNGSSSRRPLQVPAFVASGAAVAGNAAGRAAKAVAKQGSRLVKLVQATSLSEAAWLQLSSLWQSHSAAITGLTAAAATAGVYQVTAGLAGQFMDLTDPNVQWSCVCASAAAVAVAGLQIRASFTVDPERVFRITMRKLNRHAGLQEILGTPLAGSDVRLQLVSQGSLFVQETLLPRRRAPRLHLMFRLTGPTNTGVVSVVVKKVFGSKYAFKTLLVEVPDKPMSRRAAGAAAITAAAKFSAPGVPSASAPASQSSSSSSSDASPDAGSDTAASTASGPGPDPGPASHTPARIYVIGSAASSGSSARHLSAVTLLDDLKDPLLFALKRNLVGYEAEDEAEAQLGWNTSVQDPDQTTWWDETRRTAQVLACQTLSATRRVAGTAAAAIRAAGARVVTSTRARARSSSSSKEDSSINSASNHADGSKVQSAAVSPTAEQPKQ